MSKKSSKLRITKAFTPEQVSLTAAIIECFGLVPTCFVTEAYLKSVHDEYYKKQADEAIFNLLLDEKEDDLRQFMSKYGKGRRVKVSSDNHELVLFND